MEYKRFAAAFAAVSLMITAFSCGDKKENTKDSSDTAIESEVSATDKKSTKEKDKSSEDETETTKKSDKKTTTDKKSDSKTTEKADKKNETATTAADKKSAKSTTTAAKSNGTASTTSLEVSPQSIDTGRGTSSSSSDSGSEPAQSEPESEYTAEITMGATPKAVGENVTIEGNTVIITAGGDYLVKGSTDNGQVCVSTATEEKVKVILDGVDIANSAGPAILIDEAKKCTVELMNGTVSVLRDGAKDKINDGVIFSNDTLRIKGGGELCIYSNNAHGIASDDDVIIEGGTFEINSIKSGIYAHDDITVNDGELTIFGGTNGLKSKGTININGGRCVISGGTKEEKSSIYAGGPFNYTGGYVFAAGNQVSAPTTSANPFVIVDLGGSFDAGSAVEMVLDSAQMIAFEPHNNFRCLMMLAPEISAGSSYYTVINGSGGKTITLADGQNIVDYK